MIDLNLIKEKFINYVNTFDMDNENIYLKYEHTFEVVKIMEEICNRKNIVGEDKDLALAIAYLHDVGRFEQVVKTGTFKDGKEDHADNGADLLIKRSLIKEFNVPEEYYRIIELSVRLHNKLELDKGLSDREELFCKLIRDADKIDIYRVRNKYNDDHFIMEPSKINIDDFYKHKSINIKNISNKSDSLVCVMAFIYDLNFEESREVLKDLGYYERFINGIKVEDNKEVFERLKEETYKFLKIGEGNE